MEKLGGVAEESRDSLPFQSPRFELPSDRVGVQDEDEEERLEEAEKEGFGAGQLFTIARLLSFGGVGDVDLSSIFEHYMVRLGPRSSFQIFLRGTP